MKDASVHICTHVFVSMPGQHIPAATSLPKLHLRLCAVKTHSVSGAKVYLFVIVLSPAIPRQPSPKMWLRKSSVKNAAHECFAMCSCLRVGRASPPRQVLPKMCLRRCAVKNALIHDCIVSLFVFVPMPHIPAVACEFQDVPPGVCCARCLGSRVRGVPARGHARAAHTAAAGASQDVPPEVCCDRCSRSRSHPSVRVHARAGRAVKNTFVYECTI